MGSGVRRSVASESLSFACGVVVICMDSIGGGGLRLFSSRAHADITSGFGR